MDEKVYVTEEGLNKLKNELLHLKTVERIEVSKAIGEAKSFGDLSENSEYDAAKAREGQVESRIYQLENMLKNVVIIDEKTIKTNRIVVGSKVKVLDIDFNEECEYRILGASESDPENGKISNESPVGKALLGKKVGDIVDVQTEHSAFQLKVLKISA